MTPWLLKLKERSLLKKHWPQIRYGLSVVIRRHDIDEDVKVHARSAFAELEKGDPIFDKLLKVAEAAERCQVAFGHQDSSDLGPARRDLFRALNELRESVE